MTKGTGLLLLGCLFFASCENSLEDINELTQQRVAVEQAVEVQSFLSQGGQMKAKLTAPLMNRYQADTPYIEFPKTLHVDFFNDSLKVESQLNAKYGRYRENEGRVLLRDSVIVFNTKKDTLRTNELWWDQNKETFYTDKPVDIHQPDKIIHSEQGLEADQSFNWYVLRENQGSIAVPKGGFNVAPPDSTKRDSIRVARDSAARRGGVPPPPPAGPVAPGAAKPDFRYKPDTGKRRGFIIPTVIPKLPPPKKQPPVNH